MATATQRAERLAAAEKDDEWTAKAKEAEYIHPAQAERLAYLKKQEAANAAALAAQLTKDRLKRLQYEETNRKFIAGIIGEDEQVDHLKAEVATRQAALADLVLERRRVLSQLQTLDQNAAVDLSGISMGELLRTAATREKARTVEVGALVAVRDELGRRVAIAESELAETQHSLLRQQRLALHLYCDLLIEQMEGPVAVVVEQFSELRKAEEAVRELGGQRHCFSNQSMIERLQFLVERWPTEVADVERLSEAH